MEPTDWIVAGTAVLAVFVAVVAAIYSRRAAVAAEESAAASKRSAAVAEREEQRQLEEADQRAVVWRAERLGDAVLKLWNAGDSAAYDVRVDVSPAVRVLGIPDINGETVHSGDGVRVGASVRDFDSDGGGVAVRWRRTPGGSEKTWTYRL